MDFNDDDDYIKTKISSPCRVINGRTYPIIKCQIRIFLMTMFRTNFCITTAIHLLAMSPAKKASENKDYCKRYREKNREKYRKNNPERKRAQRVKVKLQNPELYELKKKEQRERKQLSRLRKKLRLINQSPITSESTAAAANNDVATPSTSFSTKQTKARSISRAEKALPKSPRKKNEILDSLAKKV